MSRKLIFEESPLLVLPTLAQKVGLNESIVLQQIHYWLNLESNSNYFQGRHWVYNTYKQWRKQFAFWSAKTIQRVIKNLEEQNMLISFIKRDPQTTKYYSINYESLKAIGVNSKQDISVDDVASGQSDHPNLTSPLPTSGQSVQTHSCKLTDDLSANESPPSQSGLTPLSNATSQSGQVVQMDTLPTKSSGQIDHPNLSRPTSPSGQSDQRHLDKLSRLYTENTTEITPPPPLSPPPSLPRCQAAENTKNKKHASKQADGKFPNGSCSATPETPNKLSPSRQEEEEEEDFKDLINIWNEEVQNKLNHGKTKVFLTTARREQLTKLLREVFANDSSQWHSYCRQISNCRFLMGASPSGFKVSLEWALQPKNALKVLEGTIFDKPKAKQAANETSTSPAWSVFDENIKQHCLENQYPELWVVICQQLARYLGRPTFKSWFFDVKPIKLSEAQVVLETLSPFRRDHIDSHFKTELLKTLQLCFPRIEGSELKISVVADHPFARPAKTG